MDAFSARHSRLSAQVITAGLLVLSMTGVALAFPLTWSLEEHQPNIKNGGRANAIAVNPVDNNIIFVAAETGGLFRSGDRGVTWHHVDTFVPYAMGAVAYVPADPNVLIATAGDGFTATNEGGGIWRSTDGGSTWTHIPNPPAPAGITTRFSAGEISIAPDTGNIYVATEYGASQSTDRGATWSTLSPFGASRAASVVAQSGNLVIAGSAAGVVRSTNGGATWTAATTGPGAIVDMHAFGRSPSAADTAYAVNSATELYYTEDSGANWAKITAAPTGGGGCGGIAFVKATFPSILLRPASRRLYLYFGNRCGLARLAATPIASTTRFDYSGTWVASTLDHSDTRDLAFTTGRIRTPLLLGTDGGLHRTADGGATWTFTGGGTGGYNALQITEVRGQQIDSVPRYDLYFGTQDNDLWTSGDLGVTWPARFCCEGFFIEMQKRVPTPTDSLVSFVSCGPCGNLRSDPLFAGLAAWANPPVTAAGNPAVVNRSFVIQGVNTNGGYSQGFAVTQDLGATWSQYATLPENRHDMPKRTRMAVRVPHGRPASTTVHYQAIRTGYDWARHFDIVQLARITKRRTSMTASVAYPAMSGFGGLGINPTMFAWYEIFAVDPLDSRHLIAPDVVNEKMMQTWDGGENWTEIPLLTSQITDSGHYLFRNWVFPHASAVSFYSADPNRVAIGTQQGGIFVSTDRGATWFKIPASERATYITSIEWRNATDLFVSTYGRGLWRVKAKLSIPRLEPLCLIINCLIRYIDRGDPVPDRFKHGILVFEGRIQGLRVERGALRQVYVSPGASIGVVGDGKAVAKIAITETATYVGLRGASRDPLSLSASGPNAVGVAVDDKSQLFGALFSEKDLPIDDKSPPAPPREKPECEEDEDQVPDSPVADKPYISLSLGGLAADMVGPGDRVTVSGVRLKPGTAIEILLDSHVVGTSVVKSDGSFSAPFTAPTEFGLHTVGVRDAKTQAMIDAAMFIVRHIDRPSDRDKHDKNYEARTRSP